MIRLRFSTACLLLSAWAAPAACLAKSDEGKGKLKEIVIEGTSRLEIKQDKPPYSPDLAPLDTIQNYLSQQLELPSFSPKILLTMPQYFPDRLASPMVLSPWQTRLSYPPILDILISHPKGVKIAKWRMVVTDDLGNVFYTLRGKGRMPDRLSWDGIGESGEMLKVGRPYAYSYHIITETGVPHYLRGKTVLVDGVVDDRKGRVNVAIDTKKLFSETLEFSKAGRDFMREAQDAVRKLSGGRIEVTVYGEDPAQARRQANKVREYLIEALNMGKSNVVASSRPLEKDRYARTEIAAR